jgi:hypothetical protein
MKGIRLIHARDAEGIVHYLQEWNEHARLLFCWRSKPADFTATMAEVEEPVTCLICIAECVPH